MSSSRRSSGQGKRRSKNASFVPKSPSSIQKEIRTQLLQVAERKYKETEINTTVTSYTGNITQLNTVSQGSTVNTRNGDSLYAKSLVFRSICKGIGDDDPHMIRFLVIRWLPNSTPTTAQILDDSYVGTTRVCYAGYNHFYKKQFKVLYDSGPFMVQACSVTAGGGPDIRHIANIVIPLNVKIDYDSASSTNSNNRLYYVAFSEDATGNIVAHQVLFRLNFLDM